MLRLILLLPLTICLCSHNLMAAKTAAEVCSFAKNLRSESDRYKLELQQANTEQNPIKQQEARQSANQHSQSIMDKFVQFFSVGGQAMTPPSLPQRWEQEFHDFTGVITKLDQATGEGSIMMVVEMPCDPAPIDLYFFFYTNWQKNDPNRSLSAYTNMADFRATLKELSRGDKVSINGVLLQGGVTFGNPDPDFLNQKQVVIPARLTKLTKL